jgi:uncharacterized integral membrane protein (TIGR00698 family)
MVDNLSSHGTMKSHPQDVEPSLLIRESEKKIVHNTWIPGIILVFIIGLVAYGLSRLHHSLDALAMAILLGIIIRAIFGEAEWYFPGVRLGLKIFIPHGIILYGSNLSFTFSASLPPNVIILTLLSMVAFYIVITLLNRLWKVAPKTGELIADGSAICGASAIAVISPAVEAEPKDTSVSLLVVTTIGLLGAMIYPVIKELLHLPDAVYAVLSGATLHQTGIVRVAVASMDPEYVTMALTVKSIRILMLLAVTVLTVLFHSRSAQGRFVFDKKGLWDGFKRVWFLLPFLLMALLVSFPATSVFLVQLRPWATFVFSMALGSIGLMVDIESVLAAGSRPLLVGLVGWILVVLFFLLTWSIFF